MLKQALENRDAARKQFEAAKPGSKKWRDAEEDLNFWSSKVANLEALARHADR